MGIDAFVGARPPKKPRYICTTCDLYCYISQKTFHDVVHFFLSNWFDQFGQYATVHVTCHIGLSVNIILFKLLRFK